MISRREMLAAGAGAGLAATLARLMPASAAERAGLPAGALDSAKMDAIEGKRPLIKRAYRAPNYETPVQIFSDAYTPNDAFFVRWHLSDIPEIDASKWRLKIGGDGASQKTELSLDDLKRGFEQVELAAVCQCSGNRRGLSDPHVAGVEWGYGAMGNAKWRGVRLKDVLAKAGVKKEAVEVAFNGADKGVVEKTPDFVKSLPMWKALDENTIIALEMNGQPLPHWNGFPARIIASGWTATYWVKQVTDIEIRTEPFTGFWMASAYRIPKGKFPVVDRFLSQEAADTTPITEMVVNSLITNLAEGQRLTAGQPLEVRGIAWDGGYGIREVAVSTDGGKTWTEAKLGEDLGRFAWRQWSHQFTPQRGSHQIMARATNRIGQTQTGEAIWNPAGYHNNVISQVGITVA